MPGLFDHFYRVTWDLLSVPKKTRKGRKGNCAMVVASCNRREGASTIALNIASAFSSSSMKSVVLIDGNLRNPVLHEYFGCDREYGLSELVMEEISLKAGVVEVRPERFYFIPAGRKVQNPILLFETPEFIRLLDELRDIHDLIIFDSAPLTQYPETPILASHVDGVVMVVEAEGTRWEVASAAKHNLETANANIFGAILNKREYYIPRAVYNLL
jgi:capsular exopolysaccharide synthesis family protein